MYVLHIRICWQNTIGFIQSARMLLCPVYGYDIIEVRQVDYTFKVKKVAHFVNGRW